MGTDCYSRKARSGAFRGGGIRLLFPRYAVSVRIGGCKAGRTLPPQGGMNAGSSLQNRAAADRAGDACDGIASRRAVLFHRTIAKMAAEPAGGTSAEFGQFLGSQVAHWSKVVKESGIKMHE